MLCECGCGKEVRPNKRFRHGHASDEVRKRRSEAIRNSEKFLAYKERRVRFSREILINALNKSRWIQKVAAKFLGINFQYFWKLIKKYQILHPSGSWKINQSRLGSKITLEIRKKMSHHKGEERYNWEGGIRRDTGVQLEVKLWREQIWERDGYLCQECGKQVKKKNRIAHHILDWENYPDLRFDISNGLTLCRGCHMKIHEIGIETRFAA
jgi:hypothetical protein